VEDFCTAVLSLRIIAVEADEPVRSEFRRVVEAQSIGLSMGEAVSKLYESIPATEANFFSIVINIQQKAGGNLSEALGNLSRVLRERKKMKLENQGDVERSKSIRLYHRSLALHCQYHGLPHQPAVHGDIVAASDRTNGHWNMPLLDVYRYHGDA
jgi:hypothetical protein